MRVKATKAERFDALFREHHATVRGYARRRADDERAQDAVAETFLIAWRRIDEVPEDALPWLLGVTRKVLANQRRSDGRGAALAERLAEVAAGAAADDPADVVTRAVLMRAAFERLSARDRATLLEAAGWDAPATASTVAGDGVSSGALAVRLHRARGRLKAQIEKLGTVPVLLIALAVAAGLLLTPPGRAGVTWAIELIGIGEVGGSPTKADRWPMEPMIGPLVIGNGRGPTGERYEWVAHRGGPPAVRVRRVVPGWRPGDLVPDGPVRRIPATTGLCLFLEWPARRIPQAWGGCDARPERQPPAPVQSTGPIQSLGWSPVRRGRQGGRPSPAMLMGTTGGAVHGLAISYAAGAGRRELDVDFARVDGSLLRRLGMPPGKPGPFGVFTAFVPARIVARDDLMSGFPSVLMLVDDRLRTGDRATDACIRAAGPPPVAPYSLVAYGGDGRVVERRRTLDGGELPRECANRWLYGRSR